MGAPFDHGLFASPARDVARALARGVLYASIALMAAWNDRSGRKQGSGDLGWLPI